MQKGKTRGLPCRRKLKLSLCLFVLLCTACAQFEQKSKTLTILSYNVEALFDSEDNGNEYKDYSVAKGSWTETLYRKRIANLVSAILCLCPDKPDILLLQEIENERVLTDLAEALGGYAEQIAAPQGSGSITVGILSKYPLTGATAHQYQFGIRQNASARLLLEVRLDLDGVPVVLLNAHWKSKKEGDRKSVV